jgi:hypothetical protein
MGRSQGASRLRREGDETERAHEGDEAGGGGAHGWGPRHD